MGVIINDEELAKQLHLAVSSDALVDQAYEVLLSEKGRLQWRTLEDNKLVVYNQEPDIDMTDKIWIKIMTHQ